MAPRGHCRGEGNPVTDEAKKTLAKLLYEKAPKSLGDAKDTGNGPQVRLV